MLHFRVGPTERGAQKQPDLGHVSRRLSLRGCRSAVRQRAPSGERALEVAARSRPKSARLKAPALQSDTSHRQQWIKRHCDVLMRPRPESDEGRNWPWSSIDRRRECRRTCPRRRRVATGSLAATCRRRDACVNYTSHSHATNETGDGWTREAPRATPQARQVEICPIREMLRVQGCCDLGTFN